MLSWSLTSETFTGPDETAHYLRALTISQGRLLGPRVPYQAAQLTATQLAYVNGDSRGVHVPPAMNPGLLCDDGAPDTTGCEEASYTGDYFPLPYLLPAVGLAIGHSAIGSMWLARVASVIPCILLLIGAVLCLWETDLWSVLGLLGALSPMVFFVCSVLNPSGLETAATIAFTAGLLKLARPGRTPKWIWPFTCVAGFATILSFQAGPGFLFVAIGLTAGLFTHDRTTNLLHDHLRGLGLIAATVIVGIALWLAYDLVAGSDHAAISFTPPGHSIYLGLAQLPDVLRDAVGNFGALTIALPGWSRWTWWLAIAAMIAMAFCYGDRRGRFVTVVTVVVALLFPVLSFAWIYRTTGYGMQGREVLGVLALIPLICGEVLYRNHQRGSAASSARSHRTVPIAPLGLIAFAAFQAYAWWVNAHTSAWATPGVPAPGGVLSFIHFTHWAPPLGWTLWTAVAGSGLLLLVMAAVTPVARTQRRRATGR